MFGNRIIQLFLIQDKLRRVQVFSFVQSVFTDDIYSNSHRADISNKVSNMNGRYNNYTDTSILHCDVPLQLGKLGNKCEKKDCNNNHNEKM